MPRDDDLRQHDAGLVRRLDTNRAFVSMGVVALGASIVKRLVQTISLFDDYCAVTESHLPGQFDSFEFDGIGVRFRVDYERLPGTSSRTQDEILKRMITITLADGT